MHLKASRQLSPKKMLLSKWTATSPSNKEKHFLVTLVVLPKPPDTEIDLIELEAVYSGRRFSLRWRELADKSQWLQGWQ